MNRMSLPLVCAIPPFRLLPVRPLPLVSLLLVFGLIGAAVFWRISSAEEAAGGKGRGGPRAAQVEMTTVTTADAPVELEAIGQLQSSHQVAIRPQLSGTLTAVHFTEGDAVQKGQLLFTLDAAPSQASLAQAKAQMQAARANLSAANAQQVRLQPLVARGYVTPQELEAAVAAAGAAQAAVALAQAQISAAGINVQRTRIYAPISGRTGALAVRSGNVVGPSDAQPLATINQLQPVHAVFSVPQASLAAVRAAQAKGALKISASLQEAPERVYQGRLEFIDNQVEAASGTVRMKAVFANEDESLWPGSFVSLVLTLDVQANALLVPETAVQQGANGPYVFMVTSDSKAQLTEVVVDRQLRGKTVIRSGLKGGERIIARPPRDLRPGTEVKPQGAGDGKRGALAQSGGKPSEAKAEQARKPAP